MTTTAREMWWPHHESRDRRTALAELERGDVGEVTLEFQDFIAIADRIDALEKALRLAKVMATHVDAQLMYMDLCDDKGDLERNMRKTLADFRAALGEGE